MTAKTSGDSTRGVSGIIFRGIQDSFTTQGLPAKTRGNPAFTGCFGFVPPPSRFAHERVNRLPPG